MGKNEEAITSFWLLASFFSNVVYARDIYGMENQLEFFVCVEFHTNTKTMNKVGCFIAFAYACRIFHMPTLFVFSKELDIIGLFLMVFYLFNRHCGVWLLQNIVSSLKLMLLSF